MENIKKYCMSHATVKRRHEPYTKELSDLFEQVEKTRSEYLGDGSLNSVNLAQETLDASLKKLKGPGFTSPFSSKRLRDIGFAEALGKNLEKIMRPLRNYRDQVVDRYNSEAEYFTALSKLVDRLEPECLALERRMGELEEAIENEQLPAREAFLALEGDVKRRDEFVAGLLDIEMNRSGVERELDDAQIEAVIKSIVNLQSKMCEEYLEATHDISLAKEFEMKYSSVLKQGFHSMALLEETANDICLKVAQFEALEEVYLAVTRTQISSIREGKIPDALYELSSRLSRAMEKVDSYAGEAALLSLFDQTKKVELPEFNGMLSEVIYSVRKKEDKDET